MLINSLPDPHNRLYPGNAFRFSCRKDLACFGTCCRNRDITLTPYDVLRLKNALKLHSDDFLSRHTLYRMDPASGFPVISLKMGEDEKRLCPFLEAEGCSVYKDRPTACRLFPLARASGIQQDSAIQDEFFFMLDAPGCIGKNEEKAQDLREWLSSQGMEIYRTINDKMLHLLFHPDRKPEVPLSDSQLQKVIVACYSLDTFREFVFKTKFLQSYILDKRTRSLIEKDDLQLLLLGFSYLKASLFS